jgi:hypothetical protein
VKGGGERELAAATVEAGRDSQGTFRRDVNGIGPMLFDQTADLSTRPYGETNLRVSGAGDRPEEVRGDDVDLVVPRLKLLSAAVQRCCDTVDLRQPGVGHQCNS